MKQLPPRKRRTREHVIADLSVNHVERLILRCGWVPRRMNPDYGIDLYMETYNKRGEIENEGVSFQRKASEHVTVVARKKAIAVRMEWRDLLFWLNERMPGILVIFDATQEKAWWLHFQAVLRDLKPAKSRPPARTATLHVPLANPLDEAAIQHFAELRDAALKTGDQEP